MKLLQNEIIENLAVEFSNVLKSWFTLDQLKEVNRLNKTPEYAQNNCCATHDYFDTNEAMNEAFEKVLKREFIFFNSDFPETEKQHEQDILTWSKAWTIAMNKDFFI